MVKVWLVLWVLRVLEDRWGHRDHLATMDCLDLQAWRVLEAPEAKRVLTEKMVLVELQGFLATLAKTACQVRQAKPVLPGLRASRDHRVFEARQDHKGRMANGASRVLKASQDHKVSLARRVQMAQGVQSANRAFEVVLDQKDSRAHEEMQGQWASRGLLENEDRKASLECREKHRRCVALESGILFPQCAQ